MYSRGLDCLVIVVHCIRLWIIGGHRKRYQGYGTPVLPRGVVGGTPCAQSETGKGRRVRSGMVTLKLTEVDSFKPSDVES
jgi:hypothetical protein